MYYLEFLKDYLWDDLRELQHIKERNQKVKIYKETTYTEKELANIEQLANKYNFRDLTEYIGLKENLFLEAMQEIW